MTVATRIFSSRTRRYFYAWKSLLGDRVTRETRSSSTYLAVPLGLENFTPAAHQEHANNSDRSPTSFKPRINLSATAVACCDEKTNANADRCTGSDPAAVSIPANWLVLPELNVYRVCIPTAVSEHFEIFPVDFVINTQLRLRGTRTKLRC